MKKPTDKWNPVFKTTSRFTPEKVKDIFKTSKVPRFKVREIQVVEDIADRLNEMNISYHNFKHRNEAPAQAKVRDELKRLQKLSKTYYEALANLGFTAKTQLGPNDPEFYDNLKYNVKRMQMEAENAIQSIKTKPGAGKKSRSTAIIMMSVIFKEVTGRDPGFSRNKIGKPGGPFFRFVQNCLKCIDPAEQIGDETLAKEIKKALSLRDEYFRRVNSTL